MGLTRKMLSMGTLGAVDFRSDKERTAAYARGTRRQARKQTRLMQQQAQPQPQQYEPQRVLSVAERLAMVQMQYAARQPVQPGWYTDPNGAGCQRWWDGYQWTHHVAPFTY